MIKFATLAIATVTAATLFTVVSTPAFAADDALPSISIRTADINLTTADGIKQLNGRIRRAARMVCGDSDGHRDLNANIAFDRCVVLAISQAQAAVEPKIAAANAKAPVVTAAR
ncbi:MAG: UrcA family protein [Sphingomonadaceae bacterium]